jgi:hypothetical protein
MKQGGAFRQKIIANMRAPQGYPRIRLVSLLGLPGKSERLAGDLHLTKIGVLGDLYKPGSIEVTAVKIHPRIGAGWISAQNVIE